MEPTPTDQAEPTVRKAGWRSHKPGCICSACKAQRRKEEAITFPDRIGGDAVALKRRAQEVINADSPLVIEGHTAKDRVVQWAAMRAQHPDWTRAQLAEKMGISRDWLNSLVQQAVREGWLKFQNPLSRIEHEIIPKVVDNLSEFLTKGPKENPEDRQLRAKVTLETAKGTVYREYQESKGIKENTITVLALKIETPPPEALKALTGEIIGQGRELESGDVEDDK
jgi:hypothetical protein